MLFGACDPAQSFGIWECLTIEESFSRATPNMRL
jgi:hypothetical protein